MARSAAATAVPPPTTATVVITCIIYTVAIVIVISNNNNYSVNDVTNEGTAWLATSWSSTRKPTMKLRVRTRLPLLLLIGTSVTNSTTYNIIIIICIITITTITTFTTIIIIICIISISDCRTTDRLAIGTKTPIASSGPPAIATRMIPPPQTTLPPSLP